MIRVLTDHGSYNLQMLRTTIEILCLCAFFSQWVHKCAIFYIFVNRLDTSFASCHIPGPVMRFKFTLYGHLERALEYVASRLAYLFKDCSDSKSSLEKLPFELLQSIAGHLPISSAHPHIRSITGTQYWHKLRLRSQHLERIMFPSLCEKDLPGYWLCHNISRFHAKRLKTSGTVDPICVELATVYGKMAPSISFPIFVSHI